MSQSQLPRAHETQCGAASVLLMSRSIWIVESISASRTGVNNVSICVNKAHVKQQMNMTADLTLVWSIRGGLGGGGGRVKCVWLNHECWVKSGYTVIGSQLCKWSLFDAWIHSQREYADCHLARPTSTPRTTHPHYEEAFAVRSRIRNKEGMMSKLNSQLYKKSLMWTLWAEMRE